MEFAVFVNCNVLVERGLDSDIIDFNFADCVNGDAARIGKGSRGDDVVFIVAEVQRELDDFACFGGCFSRSFDCRRGREEAGSHCYL